MKCVEFRILPSLRSKASRLALLCLCALVTMPAPASAQTTTKDQLTSYDYWRETGLNARVFEENIVPDCLQSSRNFLGCMSAINRLSMRLSPPQVITTDEEKELGNPTLGEKIANFGGGLSSWSFHTVKTKEVKEAREVTRKAKTSHVKALQNLYHARPNIPFSDLIEGFLKELLVGEHRKDEAYYSSLLFNGFYEAAFDPHTRINPVSQDRNREEHAGNRYGGIGVSVMISKDKKGLFVSQVYEDSPAQKAGIKWNDLIQTVDGVAIETVADELKTKSLSGEIGSTATLEILRNQKIILVNVHREIISVPNVRWKMLRHLGQRIGFISLASFVDKYAAASIKQAIDSLTEKGAQGLILDLRSNPGGLINVAVDIASLFLGKEVILKTELLANKNIKVYRGKRDALTKLPLVTLINSSSASASELLSGALQDHQRGWIVGDRSYGKGSAQISQDWKPKNFIPEKKIQLWSTDMVYLLPSGRSTQIVGVIPDFYTPPKPNQNLEDLFNQREEDLFTNAFPARGRPWEQPRLEQVASINQCRNAHRSETLFENPDETFTSSPDFQVLVAEEILNCAR